MKEELWKMNKPKAPWFYYVGNARWGVEMGARTDLEIRGLHPILQIHLNVLQASFSLKECLLQCINQPST